MNRPQVGPLVVRLHQVQSLMHDTVWAWVSEQQTAFEKIKTALTTLPVLTYSDKDKDHIMQTDASKTGHGAILLQ